MGKFCLFRMQFSWTIIFSAEQLIGLVCSFHVACMELSGVSSHFVQVLKILKTGNLVVNCNPFVTRIVTRPDLMRPYAIPCYSKFQALSCRFSQPNPPSITCLISFSGYRACPPPPPTHSVLWWGIACQFLQLTTICCSCSLLAQSYLLSFY